MGYKIERKKNFFFLNLFQWQLGYFKEEYCPTKRGFDTQFGFYNDYVDYFDHIHAKDKKKVSESQK